MQHELARFETAHSGIDSGGSNQNEMAILNPTVDLKEGKKNGIAWN